MISLHHYFTSSLFPFPLDIWKPGGELEKANEENNVDVAWASLDLLKTPLKTEELRLLAVQERIPRALVVL